MKHQLPTFILLAVLTALATSCGSPSGEKKMIGAQLSSYREHKFAMTLGTVCSGNQPARGELVFDLSQCQRLSGSQQELLRDIGPLVVQVSNEDGNGNQLRVYDHLGRITGVGAIDKANGVFEITVNGSQDYLSLEGCQTQLIGKATGNVSFARSGRVTRIDIGFIFDYAMHGASDASACSQFEACVFAAAPVALICE